MLECDKEKAEQYSHAIKFVWTLTCSIVGESTIRKISTHEIIRDDYKELDQDSKDILLKLMVLLDG